MINMLITAIVQIVLFTALPFIWWLITARKKMNFFKWLGLKKPENTKKNKTVLWTIGAILGFFIVSAFMLYSVRNIETAASDFTGLGAKAIPSILIYAIFKTGLAEEIVFRGFLLKRISNKFGFAAGNLVQSILFGIMHGAFFISAVGIVKAILIIIFTGSIAWVMGFINEKKAGGSIIPSWCIHASANIFSGICSAFLLI
ncbi:MAG: CPBP family intramembrane metalloprotease [Clostridiales bacterium]|nr:CPBP family intramembrane metalloprotease [Clostridiales bacterium]